MPEADKLSMRARAMSMPCTCSAEGECGLIHAMDARFDTIAIVGKYQSPEVADTVLRVAALLRERGHTVLIEQGTAGSIGMAGGYAVAAYDEIGARADVALVLGGDGTMLNTARRLAEHDVPLIGVNQGRLGFLTDVGREDALERLPQMLAGTFTEERRSMLEVEVLRNGERVFRALALNDVVVNKGDIGRMIEFDLSICGEFVYTQRSDGMIVTTPTGSTAYALAANGPILHPKVGGMALVPLCPHGLTSRPITLPDSGVIDIALLPPHDARVHCDGQTHFDARAGDGVRVSRAPHVVRLLHPPGYSYFAMLREKLHWSAVPRVP